MRLSLAAFFLLCPLACSGESTTPQPAPQTSAPSAAASTAQKTEATRRGWTIDQIRTATAYIAPATYYYRYSCIEPEKDARIHALLAEYAASPCGAIYPIPEFPFIKRSATDVMQWADRVLTQLSVEQDEDGSWRQDLVATSEVMLAFLNCGNSPKVGPFRKKLRKAQPWLLARFDAGNGFCGSTVQEHVTATNALSELYAMSETLALNPYLKRAQRILLERQNADGSWGGRQELVWRSGSLCWQDDPVRRLTTTALALQALYTAADCSVPAPDLPRIRERARNFASGLLTPCGLLRKSANSDAGFDPTAVAAGQFILVFTKDDTDPTLQQIGALAYLMRELPAYLAEQPAAGRNTLSLTDMGAFHTFSERQFMQMVLRSTEAVVTQQMQALLE